ncbi:MAG: DUF87 domain-containing protein [Kouleothrix sp.]
MQDFEKLGAFYLGKGYDLDRGAMTDELILYDSKDLTTHAVIIGMTGSGKTGLGIDLIEEAAIDHIPVIAIDPKGDLGNLLLTFPNLDAASFQPWLPPPDPGAPAESDAQRATELADRWRKGLADWGEDGARIQRMLDAANFAIYTPGSSAGTPISVLRSFKAPSAQLRDDVDLYRERVQATAMGILTLMGIDADPITSREHVLLSNLLDNAWQQGQDLDVAGLIRAIQQPPFDRVGVLDVESFFPSKDRAGLAMQLNNLLAAPGFAAWMDGEPLDTGRLLFTDTGKPRVSVVSIAHLSDRERMFFVATLLNDVVSWMRTQPGSTSLRAILYMDEIFGYLPPVANPPTKALFLTLLKQARAFGLGLVLATQNPVDLDYKALSNIGTWMIGRLQTERDKARVMEGLEGAAAGGSFDQAQMERILAGLGKRIFLMHNVHEDHPVVFTTRWTLSYLAGPLTREQIKKLKPASAPTPVASAASPVAVAAPPPVPTVAAAAAAAGPPVVPPQITQYYVPPRRGAAANELTYRPFVVGAADVTYANAKYNVQQTRRVLQMCPIADSAVPVEWDRSATLDLDASDLEKQPDSGVGFAKLPAAASKPKNYDEWDTLLSRWLRTEQPLTLLQSATLKATSAVGEAERDFRIRLQELARQQRDDAVEDLRKRYATRIATLEDRARRADQEVAKQQEQASAQKLSSVVSIGESLLGSFFGRKRSTITTAVRGFGRMQDESSDVGRAQANAESVRAQLSELQAELQREIDTLSSSFDAQREPLETVTIAPKSSDIVVHFVGLAWVPFKDGETEAWI